MCGAVFLTLKMAHDQAREIQKDHAALIEKLQSLHTDNIKELQDKHNQSNEAIARYCHERQDLAVSHFKECLTIIVESHERTLKGLEARHSSIESKLDLVLQQREDI